MTNRIPLIVNAGAAQIQELPSGDNLDLNGGSLVNVAGLGVSSLSASGNVEATYFLGDGSQLTNLPAGNYSNANVEAFLPTYTGNLHVDEITAIGLVYAEAVEATGNITADYFIGDGSLLTGLPPGYSNANAAAYIPTDPTIITIEGNIANIEANLVYGSNELANTNANVLALGNALGNTNGNVVALTAALAHTDSNVANTNSNVNTLAANLSSTDSNVANLVTALASTDSNVANLTGVVASTDSNVANLVTALSNTDSNVANLVTELASTDSNVANLVTELASTDSNVANLVTELAATDSNVANAFVAISSTDSNVVNVVTALASTDSNVANISTNVTILQGNVVSLTGAVANANTELAHLEHSVLVFSTLAIETESNVEVLFGQVANTNSNVANTDANVANISSDFANSIALVNSNVANLVTELASTDSNVANAFTAIAAVNSNVANTNGNVSNAFSAINSTNIHLASTDSNVANLVTALSHTDSNVANAFTAIAATNSNVANTDSNVSNAFTAIAATNSNVANTDANIVAINSNISNIEANISSLSASAYSNANAAAYLPVYDGNILANVVTANIIDTVGNVNVGGNLNVLGNITSTDVNDLVVGDPLIYLGANNTGDVFDLGFVASYNDGGYAHTGIARNAVDNLWTFFDGVVAEPNTVIDWANATYPTVKAGHYIADSLSVTGNVTGDYILGNGAFLTGLPAGYSNASVDAYLPVYSGNVGDGNGYIFGNAAFLSGLPATYANANVEALLASGNVSNLTLSNLSALHIPGGANGQFLMADGAGGFSYSNIDIVSVPTISFTAPVTGNNQVFSNVLLAAYTDVSDLTVFYNGVLLDSAYYSLSGDQLTISTLLNSGAAISVARTIAGNVLHVTSSYGNSNVADYLSSYSGNISAGYFIGDGSLLTGISAGSNYGNSNLVNIGSNAIGTTGNISGNVILASNSVYATLDAVVGNRLNAAPKLRLASYGNNAYIQVGNGAMSSTGNIVFAPYTDTTAKLTINTSTGTLSATGGISSAGSLSATGSVRGSSIITTGYVYADGSISGGSFSTGGTLNVTGNTTAGNINCGGVGGSIQLEDYTATGIQVTFGFAGQLPQPFYAGEVLEVYGSTVAGINGTFTVTAAGPSSVTVASLMPAGSGSLFPGGPGDPMTFGRTVSIRSISTTGNITGAYLFGDGSGLTGLPAGYSNANLANIGANAISTTGNISGGYFSGNGAGLTSVEALMVKSGTSQVSIDAPDGGGRFVVGGNTKLYIGNDVINARIRNEPANVGNIVYYNPDTVELTWAAAPAVYGNANVEALLSSGNVGNITAAYFFGDGSGLTGLPASFGNADLADIGANAISTTGNISGGYFIGNGALLTGIAGGGSYGDANVITLLESGNVANIDISGTFTINGAAVGYLNVPQVAENANATFALSDQGKHYYSTTSTSQTLTIPANASVAFPLGAVISVVLTGSGGVTVAPDTGVSLYLAGNSTSTSRTVSPYGMATIMKVGADTWFITGAGVA